MSTVIEETANSPRPASASRWLIDRLMARRRRNIIRKKSMVRFRLTREGVHFVGVLLFIFFGAVVRDINLLILLAGAMIGLLVLQWRFNVRTLVGLKTSRSNAQAATAGQPMRVVVQIVNPKRWLGSWLVLVEDPVRRVQPIREKHSGTGSAIVDEVRPQGQSSCRYELTFNRRGCYELGPTTISTRFPIGLGRGWRTLDNQSTVIVRPELGKLLPVSKALLQMEQQGHTKTSNQAGISEAEFFGLRAWATGDSKRWIHWRTTARLGELCVRQFERKQHEQLCVLLDLFGDPSKNSEVVEKAISFLATLATNVVLQRRGKLAVAVAGQSAYVSPVIQSPILVDNLLDALAVATPSLKPNARNALDGINLPLSANPRLLVISTRPQDLQLLNASSDSLSGRLMSRVSVSWLNAQNGDLEKYCQWISNK